MFNNSLFIKNSITSGLDYLINLIADAGNVITDLAGNIIVNDRVTTVEDPVGSGNYVEDYTENYSSIDFPELYGEAARVIFDNPFTIYYWIKTSNAGFDPSSAPFSLAIKGPSVTNIIVRFNIYYYYAPSGAGNYGFFMKDIGKHKLNPSLVDNTWHLLTITHDGSLTTDGISLYFDGVLETNTVNYGTSIPSIGLTSSNVYFQTGEAAASNFTGRMSKFRIINECLSESTILNIYNSEKSLFGL